MLAACKKAGPALRHINVQKPKSYSQEYIGQLVFEYRPYRGHDAWKMSGHNIKIYYGVIYDIGMPNGGGTAFKIYWYQGNLNLGAISSTNKLGRRSKEDIYLYVKA